MKSSLKEINGRYYMPAKVVILPTKEKAAIVQESFLGNKRLILGRTLNIGDVGYHLYITSDEEIEVGDWVLETLNKVIFQLKVEGNDYRDTTFKKIIATTDTYISPNSLQAIVPKPSQSFIKAYIEAYNSGNVITDVLVEYEKRMTDLILGKTITILKIDSDNTITIKKVKECWSREEVEQLLQSAVNDSHCNAFYRVYQKNSNACCEFTNRWIAENL